MGSWGTALYSNDTSSDVRNICNEVYPLVEIEEGTKLILKEYADSVWNIDKCGFTDFYTEEIANKLAKNISPPYEAYKKYMAFLCVGTVREPYSKYLPEIMEEHSIYAYYDYINDKKPTLDILKKCGYLPLNLRYGSDKDNNGKNVWTYTFSMFLQNFLLKRQSETEEIVEKNLLHRRE